MKNLALIIVLVVIAMLVPTSTYASVSQWLSGTTYMTGHNVSGSLTNGIALLCMAGPILIVITFTIALYSQHSLKVKRA